MKNALNLYGLILSAGIFLCSCTEKEEIIQFPTVTTEPISEIKEKSADSGGGISANGGGEILAKGICWGENTSPTIDGSKTNDGAGSGSFSSKLAGLKGSTLYHVRAYATNSAGTAYGEEKTFTTLAPTVTDCDGNVYKTVAIGTQVWMAENLRATKFANCDPIPNVTGNTEWWNLTTSSYCWYNNDAANYRNKYGALYNFYAAVDSRNICPAGWHVPTVNEWNTLITFLGGNEVAGGKMKEAGTLNWFSPNTNASNSSGFSAVPGGSRYWDLFLSAGYTGFYWSASVHDNQFSQSKVLSYTNGEVNGGNTGNYAKQAGFCIRCLKD